MAALSECNDMKQRSEGYLLVDHRASPGLPENFMRDLGLLGPSVTEGRMFEAATQTCSHCNAVVVLEPRRTRARGYCRKCDGYICDLCSGRDCIPFDKILDDAEKQAYRDTINPTSFIITKGT
jgi:hypothetical protein